MSAYSFQRGHRPAAKTACVIITALFGLGSAFSQAEAQTDGFSNRFPQPERAKPVFTLPEVSAQMPPPVPAREPSEPATAASGATPEQPGPNASNEAAQGKGKAVTSTLKNLLATPAKAEPAPPPPSAESRPESARPLTTAAVPAQRMPPVRTTWRKGHTSKLLCSCRIANRSRISQRSKVARLDHPSADGLQSASSQAGHVNQLGSGRAVWYQHPGRTASGEVYNPDKLTAAHRTLPLGSRVRVVNRKNGRSVVVRITDRTNARAQSRANFVIDLSRGSARALGIQGVASVALYRAE